MASPIDRALRRPVLTKERARRDVARLRSQAEEAETGRFFQMSNDLLAIISTEGRFLLLNPAWEEQLGWSHEQLMAQPIQNLIHPDDVEQTTGLILAGRHHTAHFDNLTNRYRHKDGSWRWLLWSGRCEADTWYVAAKDITDRIWLERQALHDPLTRVPNRLLLMDRAHQAIARLRRSRGLVALIFIDLDRFKAINDNLGHAIGDHLLTAVAERLSEMLRDSDTVARFGGDEFVILAEDLESDAEALAVAERVLHALEKPFVVGSAEVGMLASIGVSVSHDPHANPEDLLREADVAMYRAKGAGGHRLELFDENLRREVSTRMDIDNRLRHALPRKELEIVYQPLLSLYEGKILGCEALVRWQPDDQDPIQPLAFLSLAEESELIVQISQWVLQTACTQAAVWLKDGYKLMISVNISPRGLTDADFLEHISRALEQSGLPASALCIEITEEAILRDPERTQQALREIKRLGAQIALDNFGVGRSSLSLPSTLPLDILKIDRTLIQDMQHNRSKRAMVKAIMALAKESDLQLVAVGIETEAQLAFLQRLGCSVGQGFLLRRPDRPERLPLQGLGAIRSLGQWRVLARRRSP